MKYIFDFDDVLFNITKQFKKHMYMCLEKAGIPYERALKYYNVEREKGFLLKNFILTLLTLEKLNKNIKQDLYNKITAKNKFFLNKDLIKIVKKLGKVNCYMVTHGVREYQLDKIKKTDIVPLFSQIIIVQGSKKEAVEKICQKFIKEQVLFIDDKAKHFENLDFKKYPNLKTILYTGQMLLL